MKTIAELQQEIRSMQTVLQEINNRLSNIDDELLNYKDSGIRDSNYKRIYEIADSMPIIQHPIIHYGYTVKNSYFAILILVATCEDSINDEQLLFLQRMVMADSQRTSIDLYMAGIRSVSIENVIFKMPDDVKNLSNQLVLDMLMVANLGKVKTRNTFEIIASVVAVLGVESRIVTNISSVSKTILMQDIKIISMENIEVIVSDDLQFGYYLQELDGWSDLVIRAKEKRKQLEEEKRNEYAASFEKNEKDEYGENWFYYV